jgi:molybdopterin-guanine dinucleotide biosynthesis protein A
MLDATKEKVGGIVLCGGKSSRMGRPKPWLPFGAGTMLQHMIDILREVVSPIVVVATPGQTLPSLDDDILLTFDDEKNLGPLAGLAAGLSALSQQVEAAYTSSCDVPFLKPTFVRKMIDVLGEHEIAIPRQGRYHHPLAAVYRTCIEDRVRRLLAQDRMRPIYLLDECDAQVVDVEELRCVDSRLSSLRNINTPEDYEAALRESIPDSGTSS